MIDELIEHYRILEVIGRGGMGIVYKAVDVNLDRTVAVKVLSTELRQDPDFIERFRNEARIQAALNHPNIATLFDFLLWSGSPVAVIEFIDGETLQSMLERRGPIPAHLALPIFMQALQGVAAAHRRGIIHRDIKPANLMITDEGVVKVMDFGIAKAQTSSGLTQASTQVGSASYMAPEQILGKSVDARTDIYALGVTLYQLLCGRPPFQYKAIFEIESAHVRDLPLPPTTYYPHIPPAAVEAVMRALAKDPAARFATAEEFAQALPVLHGVPYVAPAGTIQVPAEAIAPALAPSLSDTRAPRPAVARSRAPLLRTLAIAVGLVAVIGLGVMVFLRYDIPARGVVASTPAPRSQQAAPGPAPVPAPASSASAQARAPAPLDASDSSATQPAVALGPANSANQDLSGIWTGSYTDQAGRPQLRVMNLEMQQLTDGSISGSFTFKTDSGEGGRCTLEKSVYVGEDKRLRLIIHCPGASHPKYLNVPLEFMHVEPRSNSLEGGRLAFHLADDITVNLKRTKHS